MNAYSPILAFGSDICNLDQTIHPQVGMEFGPQIMPTLTTNYVMVMRHHMEESNHDMVNTLTQQMGIIFNSLIQIMNQSCQQLETQMNRIIDFFGTPPASVQPIVQPQLVRQI